MTQPPPVKESSPYGRCAARGEGVSEHDLVFLFEADEQHELALVRSLLESEDIQHVVQAEHHAAMLAGVMGNPAIKPRVLVPQRDLARARELLAASPIAEPPHHDGALSLEGALCPVHEQAATATCGRCGTFLCAGCRSAPGPAMCEECARLDDADLQQGLLRFKNRRRALVTALLGVLALLTLLQWAAEFA